MDQPPAVAFTAFTDVWPRATESEIGPAIGAIGAGRTLSLTLLGSGLDERLSGSFQ